MYPAIQSLPGPPLLFGSGESQSAEVADQKFAHGFAQSPDSASLSLSLTDAATSPESGEGRGFNNSTPRQLVILCHHLAQGDISSGGGIRTLDTRIIILGVTDTRKDAFSGIYSPKLTGWKTAFHSRNIAFYNEFAVSLISLMIPLL